MQRFPLDSTNSNSMPIDSNTQNFVGDSYMMQNTSFSGLSINPQSYNFPSSPFISQNMNISPSPNQMMNMNINNTPISPNVPAKNFISGKSKFLSFSWFMLSKFVLKMSHLRIT